MRSCCGGCWLPPAAERRPAPTPLVLTAKELSADERARLDGGVARILSKAATRREDLLAEIRRLSAGGPGR